MILIVESGATKTDWCAIAPGGAVQRLQTGGKRPCPRERDAAV